MVPEQGALPSRRHRRAARDRAVRRCQRTADDLGERHDHARNSSRSSTARRSSRCRSPTPYTRGPDRAGGSRRPGAETARRRHEGLRSSRRVRPSRPQRFRCRCDPVEQRLDRVGRGASARHRTRRERHGRRVGEGRRRVRGRGRRRCGRRRRRSRVVADRLQARGSDRGDVRGAERRTTGRLSPQQLGAGEPRGVRRRHDATTTPATTVVGARRTPPRPLGPEAPASSRRRAVPVRRGCSPAIGRRSTQARASTRVTPHEVRVRTNFNALALFSPSVRTDAAGCRARERRPARQPDALPRDGGRGRQRRPVRRGRIVAHRAPPVADPAVGAAVRQLRRRFELPVVVQNQTDKDMVRRRRRWKHPTSR